MRVGSTRFLEKAPLTMPQMLSSSGTVGCNQMHDRGALAERDCVKDHCRRTISLATRHVLTCLIQYQEVVTEHLKLSHICVLCTRSANM